MNKKQLESIVTYTAVTTIRGGSVAIKKRLSSLAQYTREKGYSITKEYVDAKT